MKVRGKEGFLGGTYWSGAQWRAHKSFSEEGFGNLFPQRRSLPIVHGKRRLCTASSLAFNIGNIAAPREEYDVLMCSDASHEMELLGVV